MAITTERLELRPWVPEHLLALFDSVAAFEQRSGLHAANGLRELMTSEDVSTEWQSKLRAAHDADPWAHGFAMVLPDGRLVIGSVGFKGPPDETGMVEIAYGIVPGQEGQGYATEAAAALVGFASADPGVRLIRAHTLPTPNQSTRVLKKCGFALVGEVVDPSDGPVWRWERAAAVATRPS